MSVPVSRRREGRTKTWKDQRTEIRGVFKIDSFDYHSRRQRMGHAPHSPATATVTDRESVRVWLAWSDRQRVVGGEGEREEGASD